MDNRPGGGGAPPPPPPPPPLLPEIIRTFTTSSRLFLPPDYQDDALQESSLFGKKCPVLLLPLNGTASPTAGTSHLWNGQSPARPPAPQPTNCGAEKQQRESLMLIVSPAAHAYHHDAFDYERERDRDSRHTRPVHLSARNIRSRPSVGSTHCLAPRGESLMCPLSMRIHIGCWALGGSAAAPVVIGGARHTSRLEQIPVQRAQLTRGLGFEVQYARSAWVSAVSFCLDGVSLGRRCGLSPSSTWDSHGAWPGVPALLDWILAIDEPSWSRRSGPRPSGQRPLLVGWLAGWLERGATRSAAAVLAWSVGHVASKRLDQVVLDAERVWNASRTVSAGVSLPLVVRL